MSPIQCVMQMLIRVVMYVQLNDKAECFWNHSQGAQHPWRIRQASQP
jgi:hypothetical protein